MAAKKNHILDALGIVLDAVEGYGADVEFTMMEANDEESHNKKEAREAAIAQVDDFIGRLEKLKEEITKKY